MSGETETNVSGWTTDTLHSQILTLLQSQQVAHSSEIKALGDTLAARLNAIDKATDKFEANLTRVPTDVDKQVGQLKDLVYSTFETQNEKFHSVQNQINDRDVRVAHAEAAAQSATATAATAATTAVNAALQAQKEAVAEQNKSFTLSIDKSEKGTLEQINQQRVLLQTNYGALNDKIIAIDTRVTRFEERGVGKATSDSTHQTSNSFILAIIVAGISMAGLIVLIVSDIMRLGHP